MFRITHFFYFILLHLIAATPQINLYSTDWISTSDDHVSQNHCLQTVMFVRQSEISRQIVSFCLSEIPSKFTIEINNYSSKFTFAKLAAQNITSQQLYFWSAPIDLIERYQFYLDQLSVSSDQLTAEEIFYNCTMPRFGPRCEYELESYHSNYTSLHELIDNFYRNYDYEMISLTCYTHLQCYRGPHPACLDWTEICDGHVDCLDGDFDEQYCWHLEINECQNNEYRCANGQCIPQAFHKDNVMPPDCVDGSDELPIFIIPSRYCDTHELFFMCDDMACTPKVLTSSCVEQRQKLLLQAIFSIKDTMIADDCWEAFKCVLPISSDFDDICNDFCRDNMCIEIIENTCRDMMYIPIVPIINKNIYFAYQKTDAKSLINGVFQHPYVCYNGSQFDHYFVNVTKVLFNTTTCYRYTAASSSSGTILSWDQDYLTNLYRQFWAYDLIYDYTSTICDRTNMYQCLHSPKCISIHRRNNDINDCPHGDDEKQVRNSSISLFELFMMINNWMEDEKEMKLRYARNNISFQTTCDGFTELLPITIQGRNETDETECEQWQCNNIYTRCNHIWNCLNGEDEVGCDSSLSFQCESNQHVCVTPDNYQLVCLSLTRANDGIIDCLGASDEPAQCREEYVTTQDSNFFCKNENDISSCFHSSVICDGRNNCYYGDDEKFCQKNRTSTQRHGLCSKSGLFWTSDVEKFICQNAMRKEKESVVYFALNDVSQTTTHRTKTTEQATSAVKISYEDEPRCHRGLDLRVWLSNSTTRTCVCPPNFYGNICQYQNQRVSLVLKFRAMSDSWQIPFIIIISLIDDTPERIIHSYEQIIYLSIRDCNIKYNLYLLYSIRPKNLNRHYSIQIDIYEKVSLTYRGSLLFPVNYPFLPVHRLAYLIDIPSDNDNVQTCSHHQCIHGRCIKYLNHLEDRSFCQCNQGWSGQHCTIRHHCMCSPDSLCIGIVASNRSICACPIHKFGPRCLINSICHTSNNSVCHNGGQCIPPDEYMVFKQPFTCICSKGFSGDRCEIEDNKLVLSFEKDLALSQSIFIHFIEVIPNGPPGRATTFRTIPVEQDSLIIQWSQPFHLVFIELFKHDYHLTVVQKTYHRSTTITKMITTKDRCQPVSEIFSQTVLDLHLLRRMKYYHLPCQNYALNLSCFYDDIHLCLCYEFGRERLANCFEFNHQMTFDCFGRSTCENGGRCFQDKPDCPESSICVCQPCFYGRRCQFSTSGFGLSLDAILGYHIRPHVSIPHQPRIVQTSVALTMIFIFAGLINGLFALITFKNRIIREVGCGLYLFTSSMTVLCTTVMLGLKFWILILSQMTVISNRSFLTFQCHLIDFLLRICLSMDQWLIACVALERAITTKQGMSFNKKKSKQTARVVIAVLLLVITGTSIHDPIHRRLIVEENDDHEHENEKRFWCIVTYSSQLQTFNSFVSIVHFFGPFIINLISAIILITKKSRQQSNLYSHRTYRQLLRQHMRQHKHLFTAPALLVILALPRLIICFISKCMKSANDSWLFLIGYFISFIPSLLTFVIFILPSKFYKKHFHNAVAPYQTIALRRLQLIA